MENALEMKVRRWQITTRLVATFVFYLPLCIAPILFLGSSLNLDAEQSHSLTQFSMFIIPALLWVLATGFFTQVVWSYFHVFLLRLFLGSVPSEPARTYILDFFSADAHPGDKFFKGKHNRFRDFCGKLARSSTDVCFK